MKFTMKCPNPFVLQPLLNRINVVPFQEFGSGTCRLTGFAFSQPDNLELTIDHKPEGYGKRYPAVSFKFMEQAERRKPGRPKRT